MGIIIAIIIFGLIVTVHEFGHFICAKLSKVKVLEFSIGMGPKIIQKQFGETMYSLRALPVGGYCAMEGEDSENEDPRAFRNAKLWKRMVILVAGAVMNFVLGYCVLIPMVSMMDEVPTTTVSGFTGMRNDESVSAGFRLKTVAWQFGKRLSVPDLNEEISPLEVGFGGKLTDDRTIIY
ncbi:MAG: site-2 protease family protein, partial [Ruminococcus sp.]|nr:site-2 protease family protein [Ruminococcus sp.]